MGLLLIVISLQLTASQQDTSSLTSQLCEDRVAGDDTVCLNNSWRPPAGCAGGWWKTGSTGPITLTLSSKGDQFLIIVFQHLSSPHAWNMDGGIGQEGESRLNSIPYLSIDGGSPSELTLLRSWERGPTASTHPWMVCRVLSKVFVESAHWLAIMVSRNGVFVSSFCGSVYWLLSFFRSFGCSLTENDWSRNWLVHLDTGTTWIVGAASVGVLSCRISISSAHVVPGIWSGGRYTGSVQCMSVSSSSGVEGHGPSSLGLLADPGPGVVELLYCHPGESSLASEYRHPDESTPCHRQVPWVEQGFRWQ